jgi:hypothetical protein
MRSFECAKYEFRSKCVEPHTVPCPSQQPRQRCLAPFAPFERFAAQVVSVQLDQVERIQEHAAIVALIPDALEQRDAILAARDCLTIEDARAGASREGLETRGLRDLVECQSAPCLKTGVFDWPKLTPADEKQADLSLLKIPQA